MATGKINKYVSPSSIVNNLSTTAANYVLDARQGKALNDRLSTVESLYVKYTRGTINSGATITVTCGTMVGVFGYNSTYNALYICHSTSITALLNPNSSITITGGSGSYNIKNNLSGIGMRYMILYR